MSRSARSTPANRPTTVDVSSPGFWRNGNSRTFVRVDHSRRRIGRRLPRYWRCQRPHEFFQPLEEFGPAFPSYSDLRYSMLECFVHGLFYHPTPGRVRVIRFVSANATRGAETNENDAASLLPRWSITLVQMQRHYLHAGCLRRLLCSVMMFARV